MYFIANWKMYGNNRDIERSKSLIKLINQKKYKKIKVIYCPPYTLLKSFYDKVKKSKIFIGAQNCNSSEDFGPVTGSINPKLIKLTGAKYIIIGHSENRNQGETDSQINKKIKKSIKENLKVIFCIGEKLNEKNNNLTYSVLKKQIKKGLNKIKNFKNIIIAYEPVWSIGTGLIPKSSELKKNIRNIRNILISNRNSKKLKIVYGGSVNPNNAKELSQIKDINGFLIGGASLNSKKFIDIIKKSIN